jgi:hypothetical protein
MLAWLGGTREGSSAEGGEVGRRPDSPLWDWRKVEGRGMRSGEGGEVSATVLETLLFPDQVALFTDPLVMEFAIGLEGRD